jgi:DNA (cytosine-5)-methyltransferase 1
MKTLSVTQPASAAIPASIAEAREWITLAIGAQPGSLSDESLRRAWYAVAYLFPGLHPDESGGPVASTRTVQSWDDRLSVCCADSGWPVALLPLAAEVWRRFSDDSDLYPCEAQQAGIAAGE